MKGAGFRNRVRSPGAAWKRLQRLDQARRDKGLVAAPRQETDQPAPNPSEAEFRKRATDAGWQVTKQGWPDFIIRRADGRLAFVEVKPDVPRVSPPRWSILETLAAGGFECYVWTPKSGFHRVGKDSRIRAERRRKK